MRCIRLVRLFFPSLPVALLVGGIFTCVTVFSGCTLRESPAAPVHWELTPAAQQTYAALLLDQSIRNDDLHGLLEGVDLLLRVAPAPEPIAEAAAWLMLNKEMQQARTILEKAVVVLPDDLSLHILLAETWIEEGVVDKAVTIIQEYKNKHLKSDAATQELGILFLKVNRFQDAEKNFAGLPERLRTPFVRYCHARALSALKRPTEAVRQLEQAIREAPDFMEAWVELAKAHEAAGQGAKARNLYERILDQDPGNQDIWLQLVNLELRAKRPFKAMEVVRTGPESYAFQLNAVSLFMEARRFQEAEELLNQIKNESDAPEEVYFYLAASVYEQRRNAAETQELLTHISPGNRFYGRAFRFRAQVLFADNQYQAALEVVREARQVFPSEQDFFLMEIHLHMTQQHWQDALDVADKMIAAGADQPELLFLRGTILDAMGRKSEAFELMENIVAQHPNHVQSLNYLGYSLAEAGRDLDRAQKLLRRAVTLDPGKAYVLDSLAWAQFRAGHLQEAWESIREALNYPDSNDATIWEHYGDIAFALGRKGEARQAWKKALTFDPDNPEALRGRLEKR